jgi:autotransporter-associated beta strand protein
MRRAKLSQAVITLLSVVLCLVARTAFSDFLVANWGDNSIRRFDDVTGAFIGDFVPPYGGCVVQPHGMKFGPDGNLYVASVGTGQILRYNGTTGQFIDVFVAKGSGGLQRPGSVVFGPDGNLYVSTTGGNSVLRYNGQTGAFINTFVSPGNGGLFDDVGLVFGPNGNLYVNSGDNSSSVFQYNGTTGALINQFVTTGSGGLGSPYQGLTFGPDGDLYVGSHTNGSVLRYNGTTGQFINAVIAPGADGLNGTQEVLFGPNQNLYVVGDRTGSTLLYSESTGTLQTLPTQLSNATGLVFFPNPSLSADWTGATGTNWIDTGNWSGAVPGATTGTTNTDTALFDQNAPNSPLSIDAGRNLRSLTFDKASVSSLTVGTVGGNALLLTAGGTIQTTQTVVNPQTVNCPLVLEGDYRFTSGATSDSATLIFGGGITPGATSGVTTLMLDGANSGSNTISGVLADNGAGQLAVTKSGAGSWTLSVANTYSGSTTLTAGALRLTAAGVNNIPNSPTINVGSGATLDVTGLANSTVVLGISNAAQTLSGGGRVAGSVTVDGGLANGSGNAPAGSAISGGSGSTLTITGGL